MLKKFCNHLLVSFFIFLVKFYQKIISSQSLPSCRYLPTCSQYAVEAFEKKGIVIGILLTVKRLLSCHPFATPKVDEVP